MRSLSARSALRAALAALYLVGNVALGHAAELSVWAQRPHSASAASLELPFRRTLSAGAAAPTASSDAASLLALLPRDAAQVVSVRWPAHARGVVVFVQDVHWNAEAQRNIGRVVRTLVDGGRVATVALEGTAAPVALDAFRAFPDHAVIARAARHLLETNQISGAVHALLALTARPARAIGVDDAALYKANVRAVRQATAARAGLSTRLTADAARLRATALPVFNPALALFDGRAAAFEAGELSLSAFARAATDGATTVPPALRRFLDAAALEGALDFDRAQAERAQWLKTLMTRASDADTRALLDLAAAARGRAVSDAVFYDRVLALGRAHGLTLASSPAFALYVRYVTLADGVDGRALFDSLRDAEDARYAALTRTPDERRLVAEIRRLRLRKKLLSFSLTRDDWRRYAEARDGAPDEPALTPFLDFYRLAVKRDAAMAARVLAVAAPEETTVLVAGGFHADGLLARFQSAGYATVCLTPRLTTVDAGQATAYLGAFSQERTPLDRLFAGERLFLAPDPAQTRALPLLAAAMTPDAAGTLRALGAVDVTAGVVARTGESAVVDYSRAGGRTARLTLVWTADRVLSAAWTSPPVNEFFRRFAAPAVLVPALVLALSGPLTPTVLAASLVAAVALFLLRLPRMLDAHGALDAPARAWLALALPALALVTAADVVAMAAALGPAVGFLPAFLVAAAHAAALNILLHAGHNTPAAQRFFRSALAGAGSSLRPTRAAEASGPALDADGRRRRMAQASSDPTALWALIAGEWAIDGLVYAADGIQNEGLTDQAGVAVGADAFGNYPKWVYRVRNLITGRLVFMGPDDVEHLFSGQEERIRGLRAEKKAEIADLRSRLRTVLTMQAWLGVPVDPALVAADAADNLGDKHVAPVAAAEAATAAAWTAGGFPVSLARFVDVTDDLVRLLPGLRRGRLSVLPAPEAARAAALLDRFARRGAPAAAGDTEFLLDVHARLLSHQNHQVREAVGWAAGRASAVNTALEPKTPAYHANLWIAHWLAANRLTPGAAAPATLDIGANLSVFWRLIQQIAPDPAVAANVIDLENEDAIYAQATNPRRALANIGVLTAAGLPDVRGMTGETDVRPHFDAPHTFDVAVASFVFDQLDAATLRNALIALENLLRAPPPVRGDLDAAALARFPLLILASPEHAPLADSGLDRALRAAGYTVVVQPQMIVNELTPEARDRVRRGAGEDQLDAVEALVGKPFHVAVYAKTAAKTVEEISALPLNTLTLKSGQSRKRLEGEAVPLVTTTRLDADRLAVLDAVEGLAAPDFRTESIRVVSRETLLTDPAYALFERRLASLIYSREHLNAADAAQLGRILHLWDTLRAPYLTEEQARWVLDRPVARGRRTGISSFDLERSPLAARWRAALAEERGTDEVNRTREIYLRRLPERQEEAALRRMREELQARETSLWTVYEREEAARTAAGVTSVFEETRSSIARLTKILDRHHWNIGAARPDLGLGRTDDFFDFFQTQGALPLLKSKLLEALGASGWSIAAAATALGLTTPSIARYLDLFGLSRPMVTTERARAILDAAGWNLQRARGDLGLGTHESAFVFLNRLGLLPALREKLQARIQTELWNISAIAAAFGVGTRIVELWMEEFGFRRSRLTKEEALGVLERHGWDFGAARNDLKMRPNEEFLDVIREFGVETDLRDRLAVRAKGERYNPVRVSRIFGVAPGTAERWMDILGITPAPLTGPEFLAILDRHDWNLTTAMVDLHVDEPSDVYRLMKSLRLLPQLRARLRARLASNGGNFKDTADQTGLSRTTMQRWRHFLGLFPEATGTDEDWQRDLADRYGERLVEVDWRLPDALNVLPPGWERDTLTTMTYFSLTRPFRDRLAIAIRVNGGDAAGVGRVFGVDAAEATKWMTTFEMTRFARPADDTLAILNRHAWNLKAAAADLGARPREEIADLLGWWGVTDAFRARLEARLNANGWMMGRVAHEFGVDDSLVARWAAGFGLVRTFRPRAEILAILDANDWNVGAVREQIGLGPQEPLAAFAKAAGIEDEFKARIASVREEEGASTGRLADALGVPHNAAEGAVAALGAPRPLVTTADDIRQVLERHGWNIAKARKELPGVPRGIYDLLAAYGLEGLLKDKVTAALGAHGGAVQPAGTVLGLSTTIVRALMERFSIPVTPIGQVNRDKTARTRAARDADVPVSDPAERARFLAVAQRLDWNLPAIWEEVETLPDETYFQLFRRMSVLPELKAVAEARFAAARYSKSTAGRTIGIDFDSFGRLLTQLGIPDPGMDRANVLARLAANDWKIGKTKRELGQVVTPLLEFFQTANIVPDVKARIRAVLREENGVVSRAAARLGLSESALRPLMADLRFARFETPADAIAVLDAHGWDISKARKDLMMGPGEEVLTFFDEVGLRAEFFRRVRAAYTDGGRTIAAVRTAFGLTGRAARQVLEAAGVIAPDAPASLPFLLWQSRHADTPATTLQRSVLGLGGMALESAVVLSLATGLPVLLGGTAALGLLAVGTVLYAGAHVAVIRDLARRGVVGASPARAVLVFLFYLAVAPWIPGHPALAVLPALVHLLVDVDALFGRNARSPLNLGLATLDSRGASLAGAPAVTAAQSAGAAVEDAARWAAAQRRAWSAARAAATPDASTPDRDVLLPLSAPSARTIAVAASVAARLREGRILFLVCRAVDVAAFRDALGARPNVVFVPAPDGAAPVADGFLDAAAVRRAIFASPALSGRLAKPDARGSLVALLADADFAAALSLSRDVADLGVAWERYEEWMQGLPPLASDLVAHLLDAARLALQSA